MESEDSKIKEGGGAWVRRLARRVGVGNRGVRGRKVREGRVRGGGERGRETNCDQFTHFPGIL